VCGLRAPDRRNKSLEDGTWWGPQPTTGDDWKRVARERVEDDRLRLRGGAALDIVMSGSGRLA